MNAGIQSAKRLALIAGGTAIVAMSVITAGTAFEGHGLGPDVTSSSTLGNHAGVPLAPGDSGGEVTRGNQSGSFAPTSTNDLITPVSPIPGSPWRD